MFLYRVASPFVRSGSSQQCRRLDTATTHVQKAVHENVQRGASRKGPDAVRDKHVEIARKDALPVEVCKLWVRFVGFRGSKLTRSHAMYFFQHLDHDHVLGWAPHRVKKPPCYEEYVKVKRQHPDKLVAMQVGDFFEFAGWDAVLVIQAINIKGMGLSDKAANGGMAAGEDAAVSRHLHGTVTPRAGFPLRSSRWAIASLCRAGHEVVIVLQKPDTARGAEGKVQRYIAKICTPHSPYFQDGAQTAAAEDAPEEAPAWGLAPCVKHAGRWTVHMWQRESLTRVSLPLGSFEEVQEHLEAARTRQDTISLPVYLHSASSAHQGASRRPQCDVPLEVLQAQEQRVKDWLWRRFGGAPRVVHAVDAHDSYAFVDAVQSNHLFPPQTTASGKQAQPQIWTSAGSTDASIPLFLHESTARALGIKPGTAPDVVAQALGPGALKMHMKRVRGLLMRPPPRSVALDIAATVRALLEAHVVPRFVLHHNTSTVWSHMQACSASTAELQGLLDSASATFAALQQPAAAPIMEPLLKVASWSKGGDARITKKRLQAGCHRVAALLQPLLPQYKVGDVNASEELDQEVDKLEHELKLHGVCVEEYPIDLKPLATFFIAWERRRLHDIVAPQALQNAAMRAQQLSQKRAHLLAVLALSIKGAAHAYEVSTGKSQGDACAELRDCKTVRSAAALIRFVEYGPSLGLAGKWVKECARRKQAAADAPVFREVSKKPFFVSDDLIAALEAYREEVQDVHEEAVQVLQQATAALFDGGRNMGTLLAAQEVNEWGHTLAQVAENAMQRRWPLPVLTGPGGSLQLNGVWPYWLPRPHHMPSVQHSDAAHHPSAPLEAQQGGSLAEDADAEAAGDARVRGAVANDVEVAQRVLLMTGANMSGKSTLMRATMATALLGSVGLPVPCMDATIPEFKSFFYRCFDGDNPLAGLSGHAYECRQMKVLYDIMEPFHACAAHHLICIDELGKGTDDKSATGLCCAALQKFDQSNVVGIFATHQQDIVDPLLGFVDEMQRVYCCHMEVQPQPSHLRLGPSQSTHVEQRPHWLPWFRPTFKVLPGSSCDSLALQVAWQEGMPQSVVQEASHILAQLPRM